jgi:hypothetical protein
MLYEQNVTEHIQERLNLPIRKAIIDDLKNLSMRSENNNLTSQLNKLFLKF